MVKYLAISMTGKGKVLKKFNSANAAQKWRTNYYKTHKRSRVGILGKRGFIGPRTY